MLIPFKSLGSSLLKSIVLKEHFLTIKRQNRLWLVTIHELSTSTRSDSSKERKSVSVSTSNDKSQLSEHVKVTERIKQTTKDVTNISVILLGIGITGFIFFIVFKELLSSKSPSSVFSSALAKCKDDPRIAEALGMPIKGHGEMTRRGRARHVSSVEYQSNEKTYLRVKFYLKGSKGHTATVQCETRKDSPKSDFRYLFVQMDTYPHQVIIVEDNRLTDQMDNSIEN